MMNICEIMLTKTILHIHVYFIDNVNKKQEDHCLSFFERAEMAEGRYCLCLLLVKLVSTLLSYLSTLSSTG